MQLAERYETLGAAAGQDVDDARAGLHPLLERHGIEVPLHVVEGFALPQAEAVSSGPFVVDGVKMIGPERQIVPDVTFDRVDDG